MQQQENVTTHEKNKQENRVHLMKCNNTQGISLKWLQRNSEGILN